MKNDRKYGFLIYNVGLTIYLIVKLLIKNSQIIKINNLNMKLSSEIDKDAFVVKADHDFNKQKKGEEFLSQNFSNLTSKNSGSQNVMEISQELTNLASNRKPITQ